MEQSAGDRERAGLIREIEAYRTRHGRYPLSLHAQHEDYKPDVVGVEMYLYAPNGDGYNLSFEQPKFFLDRFGTREWVVYNPRDQHRMYSHAAWRPRCGRRHGIGPGLVRIRRDRVSGLEILLVRLSAGRPARPG